MFRTPSSNLTALLPRDIVVVVAGTRHRRLPLMPAEDDYVSRRRMRPRRRAEFSAGRACARDALAQLGVAGCALLPDAARAPLWPDGTVGSITHTNGFCAAVAARSDHHAGVGIDAETVDRVGEEIAPSICVESELRDLDAQPPGERRLLLTLIFSAKESVYKALYPVLQTTFEFHDVRIAIDRDSARFTACSRLRELAPWCARLSGRFGTVKNVVVTVAWCSRPERRQIFTPADVIAGQRF